MERSTMCRNMKCSEKVRSLDICIPNFILTPLACASLISEILKCLIFEKSLIPYPYNWLKNVVSQHKKSNTLLEKSRNNERSQRVALAAYDATENIINNVKKLFQSGNKITELLILIGATPLNPKEVYRINIPKIAKGHTESNHYGMITKYQPKLLRSLLLSEQWMTTMEQSIPLTNLYVFLKTANDESFLVDNNTVENFLPSSSFFIPKNAQSLTINLLYDDIFYNCCSNLIVYEDKCIANIENSIQGNTEEKEVVEDTLLQLETEWLQVNSIIKGFK